MSEENVIKFKPRKAKEDITPVEEVVYDKPFPYDLGGTPWACEKQFEELKVSNFLEGEITLSKDEFSEFLAKLVRKWAVVNVEVLGGPNNSPTIAASMERSSNGGFDARKARSLLNELAVPLSGYVAAFSFGTRDNYYHFYAHSNVIHYVISDATNVKVTSIKDMI